MNGLNARGRKVIGIAAATLICWSSAYVARGGYYSNRALYLLVMAAAIATLFVPWLRLRTFVPAALLSSTILLIAGAHTVIFGGGAPWWPVRQLGAESLVWLPVFVLALAAQLLVPRSLIGAVRPATAVAAAGFLVIPGFGTDVITAYDRLMPSLVVSLAVLLCSFISAADKPSVSYVLGIVEPPLIVTLGWLSVTLGNTADYASGDLRWLIPYVAGPATAAAALTNWRAGKGENASHA